MSILVVSLILGSLILYGAMALTPMIARDFPSRIGRGSAVQGVEETTERTGRFPLGANTGGGRRARTPGIDSG